MTRKNIVFFVVGLLFFCAGFLPSVFAAEYKPSEPVPTGWTYLDSMDFNEDTSSHSFRLELGRSKYGVGTITAEDIYAGSPKLDKFLTFYNGNPDIWTFYGISTNPNYGDFFIAYFYWNNASSDKSWGLRNSGSGYDMQELGVIRFVIDVPLDATQIYIKVWSGYGGRPQITLSGATTLTGSWGSSMGSTGLGRGFCTGIPADEKCEVSINNISNYTKNGKMLVTLAPFNPPSSGTWMNPKGIKFYYKTMTLVEAMKVQCPPVAPSTVSTTVRIAGSETSTSALKLRKDSKTYGIELVDPDITVSGVTTPNPAASCVHVQMPKAGGGTEEKALRACGGIAPACT